jgi:hypothetical protein
MNNNNTDCKSYLFQYFNCQGVANHWKYLTEEGAFPNCRENIKSKKNEIILKIEFQKCMNNQLLEVQEEETNKMPWEYKKEYLNKISQNR